MKGKYLGRDEEGYRIWRCPLCGRVTYQGTWTATGVLEDVPGCQHWTGRGGEENNFEKEEKMEKVRFRKEMIVKGFAPDVPGIWKVINLCPFRGQAIQYGRRSE